MQNAEYAIRNNNYAQKGSVVVLLVMAASVVALLFIISNITIFSRDFNNKISEKQLAYITATEAALNSWYKKNAATLDNAALAQTFTEDQLFSQIGIQKEFDAHIAISNIIGVAGSPVYYRNAVVWIPFFGETDTSALSTSGDFIPGPSSTLYRVVSGRVIETANLGKTQDTMREVARILEARFKAKMEADPIHDVGSNYFRAFTCNNVGPEEIPCTAAPGASTSWKKLTDSYLNLQNLAGVNPNTVTDAWGGTIEFNNYKQSSYGGSTILASCSGIGPGYSSDTEEGDPPYVASLRTTTPWGTILCMRAVQPLN